MKILVVEGELDNVVALSVAFQLQWEDATVIPAADGDAGLKAFLDHDPAVVLLDVALPAHGAFDLLKAIRLVSDVPVILLASHGDETDEVRGLELGADDYVVNPFGHLSLLAHVKAVLRRADLPPPVSAQPDFVAGDLAVHFQNREVTLAGQP